MMSEDLNIKILKAMHRIEQLYFETNGKCYLSFSGGKDSMVVLALIKMCCDCLTVSPEGIKAVFCNTRIELDATVEFVNWVKENYYSNLEIIYPEKTFPQVLAEYGKPIKSKIKSESIGRYQNTGTKDCLSYQYLADIGEKRYAKIRLANKDLHILNDNFGIKISNKCCDVLKKKPFAKYNKEHDVEGYILGIRNAEGGARQLSTEKRLMNGGKICTATKGKYTVKMPIIDWTDENIKEFVQYYDLPLSKAYTDYGMSRTGCIGCPFSRHLASDLETLSVKEPRKYKATMFWLKDVYIAQNVILPFDSEYEAERKQKWLQDGGYFEMRKDVLAELRPEGLKERFYNKDKFK